MLTRTMHVTAQHVAPPWNTMFQPGTITISQKTQSGLWFATHPNLGCGKSYADPVMAIRDMLHSHGFTAIVVTTEPQQQQAIDADTLSAIAELAMVSRKLIKARKRTADLQEHADRLQAEIIGAVMEHCENKGVDV